MLKEFPLGREVDRPAAEYAIESYREKLSAQQLALKEKKMCIRDRSSTNSMLDRAYERFNEVKRLTAELAEVENSVYRLADAIKKTQKRANALKNIMIPRFEETVKFITDALEEKEREEFSRLKVIKSQKNAKAAK